MLAYAIVVLSLWTCICYGTKEIRYDYYTATPTTDDLVEYYGSVNQLEKCTIKIKLPCNSSERRRFDGSCNNLNIPSRGTYFNPMYRMLPAQFDNGYHARKAASGKHLTRERIVRLYLLKTGKSVSPDFSQLMPGFGIFIFLDIGSVHDIQNYLRFNTKCCESEHMNDYTCAPNLIEADDPIHRFDGIRCMNMTRPLYYQDYQCTNDSVPSPIALATPAFDLSQIYSPSNADTNEMRSFSNGQLIVEEVNGLIWPPTGPTDNCPGNTHNETKCFKYHLNCLLTVQLHVLWFYRHHNYLATKLAEVNPSWDDETLFQVARDINIAVSQQIYFHEWLEYLIGRKNMIKSKLISKGFGHRDIYDDSLFPMVSLEYSYALRWFHTMQETTGKKYDAKGNFLSNYPIVNQSFRTGNLAVDNNLVELTLGIFRQPTKDYDSTVDYDIAERALSRLQKAADVATSDLHKNRLLGLAPYVDYIKKCNDIIIRTFDDLVTYEFISTKKVALLKEVYEDVRDIDLMAAMWVENTMEGGKIPKTLACIIVDNMLRAMKSDRHWYERRNRPHAFTEVQLGEIRKTSLAMVMCSVADEVTKIQPRTLLNISPDNPLTSCSEIPNIDFSAWRAE